MKRLLATLAVLLGVGAALAGCAGAEPVELSEDTVIIDVRTPAEFANGHLDGAVNIDVQSADFAAKSWSWTKTVTTSSTAARATARDSHFANEPNGVY